MRKKLDVYLTGIGTKKCFTVVFLQVFVRKKFLNLNLIGGCPEKLF
jgi:hypothetical protein